LKTYSTELKESTVAKTLPPNNVSVPQLARDTGIPRDTLYGWRRQAGGQPSRPATSATPMGVLSSEEKFAVVVETATLNELELGAYCRRKGLFAEQIIAWRRGRSHATVGVAGLATPGGRAAQPACLRTPLRRRGKNGCPRERNPAKDRGDGSADSAGRPGPICG